MDGRRCRAWFAVAGVAAAASCGVDEREPSVFRAGPDAGGGIELLGRLEVTPSSLDLGWVTTGHAARDRISVRNSGSAPLPAPPVAWSKGSDPDFVVIQDLCEARDLAPGEACEVRVQVVPTRAGALQGTLSVGVVELDVAALGMLAGDLILAPAAGSFEDFDGVLVGALKEGTFTLSNAGGVSTGPLQLGINRPEFAFVAPAPGECESGVTALESGQSCDLRLAFSPLTRGALEATLTIATEFAGSVSSTLAGRGLVPGVLESSAPALDFDRVLLTQSARKSVTFTNGGDEPLELLGAGLEPVDAGAFTIVDSDCAAAVLLEAGQTCRVEVEFRPPTTGEEMTAELVMSYGGGAQPLSLPLRGIGLLPGSLELEAVTAGEEDFGDVLVGTTLERVLQVGNPGGQASGVLEWALSEGFEVLAPSAEGECAPGVTSLVDGQTCLLRVAFTPDRRAVASGALIVSSPLAGAVALTLSGRGIIAGQIEADAEVSFGRVLTAASAQRTLTVSNVGDQPLPPPTVTLSGAEPAQIAAFKVASGCSEPLALDETCLLTLDFAPTLAVPHAATLQLSAEGSAPASVLLLGDALVPGSLVLAAAAGSSVEFGDVALGESLSRSFTLTNPGAVPSGPLTITTDDNQFQVELGDCSAGNLVDGSSCTFNVSFTPAEALAAGANVTVQSPAAGRAGIALSGRGRRSAALSATGNRDLGRANIGQATLTAPENEFTWTVNNTGDVATNALVTANGNPTEFVVSGDTCSGGSLAGQGSCQMTIRFQPGGTGQRTATITVSDPVGMLSAPIALTGLGVQLAGPGQSCVNAECQSGECTRAGVCCDTACDRACEVCSATGVCTASTAREPCGDGAQCFGVDQCKLPEGSACTQIGGAEQCGSGFCEVRFGGAGAADRVCCLEACAPGLACNAQGRCEQPTAGDGALCGRPGDLPCAAGLLCKQCVGSATGQSQCKPEAACCGDCPAGLECADGSPCQCPVGPNGLRGLPCADGCAPNREGACCPEAPDCDPGQLCDAVDNLCKECLGSADCRNARPGSIPTCSQGTCSYPCGSTSKECDGACIPIGDCCTPADCGGRACNAGTCAVCDDGERRCATPTQPQSCVNGAFVSDPACGAGQECQEDGDCVTTAPVLPGIGEPCLEGQCADGTCSSDGFCCATPCISVCQSCSTGTCQDVDSSAQCPAILCPELGAIDPLCVGEPEAVTQCVNGVCALPEQVCPRSLVGEACNDGSGVCLEDVVTFCEPREVQCGKDTLSPICPGDQDCCLSGVDNYTCTEFASCISPAIRISCDEDLDCNIPGQVCCDLGSNIQCINRDTCIATGAVVCGSSRFNPSNSSCPLGTECVPLPQSPDSDGWASCKPL